VSSSNGFVCVSVTTDDIDLRIVQTDPHNYLRNIKVVMAANEAAAKAGQIFNPAFLKLVQNFRACALWIGSRPLAVRSSWIDRAVPTNALFGTSKGVPIEIGVQLANGCLPMRG
jgi:hypothetical protein